MFKKLTMRDTRQSGRQQLHPAYGAMAGCTRAQMGAGLIVLVAAVAAKPSLAQTPIASVLSDVLQAPVHIDITPDLWGLGVSTHGVIGGAPLAARVSLGRVLSHLDGLALGQVEISKGPAFVLADVTYAHITLPGPAQLPAGTNIPVGTTFATFAAGWSFGPATVGTIGGVPLTVKVSPFVGASYTELSVGIDAPSATLASLNPTWWSPVVGARIDFSRGRSSLRLEGYTSFFSPGRTGHEILVTYSRAFMSDWLGTFSAGIGYRELVEKRTISTTNNLELRLQGPVVYVTFRL